MVRNLSVIYEKVYRITVFWLPHQTHCDERATVRLSVIRCLRVILEHPASFKRLSESTKLAIHNILVERISVCPKNFVL